MKFFEIDNCLIVDIKEESYTDENLIKIVSNTQNTWQLNRSNKEKYADTKLGKLAEEVVIKALEYYKINNYYSYDKIRDDNFKSHAPFDGIITRTIDNQIISLINNAVKKEGPKITAITRQALRNLNVRTVEVKSTRISEKYKNKVKFISYEDNESIVNLLNYLNSLDFLSYPFFTRYGNMSFSEYCLFVKKRINSNLNGIELKEYVRKIELENSSDIFIRIFIDESLSKAIIMGYIDKYEFFNPPELKKLVLYGKSEVPLYFVKSILKANPIKNILKTIT